MLLSSVLFAAVLFPGVADAAPVPKADYGLKLDEYALQIRDYQFPSGLRVMFQAEHSQPIVAITSAIDRGSEYDQEGMDGIAHVVEHLAFRTKHGDLPKNMDVIKQLGGSFNASTSVDWTNYMTIAPIDAMIPLLRVEALRMKDGVAKVTEEEVELEAEIARNELRMRYENAAIGAAWDALGEALFPADHPYGRSTIGNHQTLSNINLKAVQEFVSDNYRPENFTVVVVGDFDLNDSWSVLIKAFGEDLELLMAPEDAKAYTALATEEERVAYLKDWMPRLQEYMITAGSKPREPRVDCSKRAEPGPPITQETKYVKGMVDSDTVILGWSLPGGYCSDQGSMNMAANRLTSYIYWNLYPSWEYAKQDSALEGIGCFVSADEYASQLICYIEAKAGAGNEPERLIEKAADALYMQWDRQQLTNPTYKMFNEWSFNYAKMGSMAGTLMYVDSVSSLGGRATSTAMFTHFTGDPAFFSRNIEWASNLDPYAVQEFGRKYITRDRMVSVIVEPMDEEERARMEAAAQAAKGDDAAPSYHATQDEDIYSLLFNPEDLTPEAIARVTVTPDRSTIREITLDNGLRVAIMPYGEAPVVRVGLQVDGDSAVNPINGLAEALYATGGDSRERLLAVAGAMGGSASTIMAEGSSANLDAVLNKMRWQVEDYDWAPGDKREQINSWQKTTKKDGKYPETWAERLQDEYTYPGHPYGDWTSVEDWDVMRDTELSAMKEWIYQKWQPSNAELIIVGKVDPDKAEAAVRTYFDSWAPQADVPIGRIAPAPAPTKQSPRKVMVFDKPIATQSSITLSCQINRKGDDELARAQIVGDVMSEMVWRTLREKSGVTYGAYAYTAPRPGDTTGLYMASLVQNDAVGFAMTTMFDIVASASAGKVSDGALATAKWSRARSYVLRQQSGDQMLNRLLSADVGSFDFFEKYPTQLGSVVAGDFTTVLAPCTGNETVTIVGPKEYAEAQLKEAGIEYEVVDWEARHQATMSPRDLKKYLKAKAAAEEAEKAKKTEG